MGHDAPGVPQATVVGDDGRLLWEVHGIRYDLEKFVEKHPGGEIALRLGQGIDATSLFEAYHPADMTARRVLEKYRLDKEGTLAPPTPLNAAMPSTSAFKLDLDDMVHRHFKGKPWGAHKADLSHKLLVTSFMVAQLCCWVGWWRGSMLATLLLPVWFWLTAVNISHDASHFAFSRIPWVNDLATYASLPMLYEPITWYYQHVIEHHTHCNHVDKDVDLQHFVPLRLHAGDSKPHPAGNSTPFDYLKIMLVGIHLTIGVVVGSGLESLQLGYSKHFRPAIWHPIGLINSPKYRWRSSIGPVWTFACFATSIYLHGWASGLLRMSIPFAGVSLLFILCTQVSHIQPEVQLAELQDNPDFFKRQASTSCDYSTSSKFMSILTGGLNAQALHHALPYVSSCHYTNLYPEFARICAKHGVVLSKRRSIFHAAFTMCRHVWNLNGGGGPPPLAVAASG